MRSDGYSAEHEVVTGGIASVGVVVRDHAGWPAAAVAVTFTRASIGPERWTQLTADIQLFADELSQRISGR